MHLVVRTLTRRDETPPLREFVVGVSRQLGLFAVLDQVDGDYTPSDPDIGRTCGHESQSGGSEKT